MDKSLIISFLIIFVLRVIDTILSTLTTMFMSQGNKKIAPITGCLQTATWVTCLNLVMSKLDNPANLIVYAIAYGTGVYAGIKLEDIIASGNVILQAVLEEKDAYLIQELRDMNIMVTVMDGHGRENSNRFVLFIALKRKKLPMVRKFLREHRIFMTTSKGDMYLNI
ncbi:MAG: DUF2179 domain-containing protein [Peptostreptococcaceae bacterium]|jgi:UPF0316 protein amet_0954|nr:DUF2179 domain-containing protein [Peptostreptococcaceae bacterium]